MVTTEQIVWTIVIALVALALIGLIVAVMRKKSLADNRARAHELREQADGGVAGLPDAQARAEQAATEAEHKRLEAERAEKDALVARTEVDQERARHEDQLRAADRLDPDVNHRAKDYSPHVADPVGPANNPAQTTPAGTGTGSASGTDTTVDSGDSTGSSSEGSTSTSPASTSPASTSPASTSPASTDDGTLRDRLDGDPADGTDANGDTRPDSGGAHRA